MKSSKLIKLFKGLSRSELLEFGRYIKTPFLNRDENIIKLYDYIKKYSPEYSSPKLEKSHFLKKMSKNQAVKDRQIHDWMSDLTKKLEDYLIYTELQNRPFSRDFTLLDVMKGRQIDDLFFRGIKNIRNKLDSSPERDMYYYFNQWRLRDEAYSYSGDSKKYKNEKSIEKTMAAIDKFFCAVKLRYSTDMITLEQQFSTDFAIALLPEVLREIGKPEYKKNKLFSIYGLAIELFYDEKDETYNKLEKLIYEHLHLGSEVEKQNLLNILLNHSIGALAANKPWYLQKIFDLYVYKSDNDMFLEDGYIAVGHFINATYLATTLNEAEWLERFIAKYKQFLNDEVKENTVMLSEAHLFFTQKQFKKSLRKLKQIGGSAFMVSVRTLSIQCQYELQDMEGVLLECTNFSRYLNRDSNMTSEAKQPMKEFIRFIKSLVEAPYRKDITKEKLRKKLNEPKSMRARSWLEEKINML